MIATIRKIYSRPWPWKWIIGTYALQIILGFLVVPNPTFGILLAWIFGSVPIFSIILGPLARWYVAELSK